MMVLGWIIFSFIVGLIGVEKKIGFWGGFFVSLIFSPIIGLIITLISKSPDDEKYKQDILNTQKRQEESLQRLSQTSSISITDELNKLKKLREEDSITEEEFEKLKSKIINS